jgi:hypothetical protein
MWLLALLNLAVGAASAAAKPAPLDTFRRLAHHICPEQRLQYLTDGAWQEIALFGKGPVFSPAANRELTGRTSQFSRRLNCAQSPAVDCDVAARMYAIQSNGLMRDAVRQICRDWRCEDEATCTYSPQSIAHARGPGR